MDAMDFEYDGYIYGTLKVANSSVANGSVASITFPLAKLADRPVPELVADTGSGLLGSFTLCQRDLQVFTKCKAHAIGQSVKTSGIPTKSYSILSKPRTIPCSWVLIPVHLLASHVLLQGQNISGYLEPPSVLNRSFEFSTL